MNKILTFQDEFLQYPGSVDLLTRIKTDATQKRDSLRIAIHILQDDATVSQLKSEGIVDFIQTAESFRMGAMAVGLASYFYIVNDNIKAKKNIGNPDWNMLAKAALLMGLPIDGKSLHRLHDNYWRWQKAEERHDAAYFSPLFFMMLDDTRGMAVDYDWGTYKRYESVPTPLFRREENHPQGNKAIAEEEGFAYIRYPSREIIEILENANTGKTSQNVIHELREIINNWDGSHIYHDIGGQWGIYTEGSPIFQQAETWLRGEQSATWRRGKEK